MSTKEASVLSPMAKAELLIGVALIAIFLYAREDLGAWVRGLLPSQATVAYTTRCSPPATEHEQLHVILAWREGELVHIGCQYIGSQSAYVKPRRP